jgi:hypothetical protein
MFETAYAVFEQFKHPPHLMLISAYYLPVTIVSLLLSGQFSILFSPSGLRHAWFARFWGWFGPRMKEGSLPNIAPSIRLAKGVVIDVGPGSGEWIGLFDKEVVTKVRAYEMREWGFV